MSRLTGLGIVVRSLPQRPDTTNPGIRDGISAGERKAGNARATRTDISDVTANFAHFILINVAANKSSKIDILHE